MQAQRRSRAADLGNPANLGNVHRASHALWACERRRRCFFCSILQQLNASHGTGDPMSRPWLCLLLAIPALLVVAPLAAQAAWLPGDAATGSENDPGATAGAVKTYAIAIGVPLILSIALFKLLYDFWRAKKISGGGPNDRWYSVGWRS